MNEIEQLNKLIDEVDSIIRDSDVKSNLKIICQECTHPCILSVENDKKIPLNCIAGAMEVKWFLIEDDLIYDHYVCNNCSTSCHIDIEPEYKPTTCPYDRTDFNWVKTCK